MAVGVQRTLSRRKEEMKDGKLSPKEEKRLWKRREIEEEEREERRAERQAELRERYWENE